ncbi:MAG: GAF domain-containing protein [Fibrobacter sp.]|nr:GAF domain-containing protein [Fibrobacter sp.]
MTEKILRTAIVGSDEETERIRQKLSCLQRFEFVKCLDPERESLMMLSGLPGLDLLINASTDQSLPDIIKRQYLPDVEILSDLSAELLFCTDITEHSGNTDPFFRSRVLNSLQELRYSSFLSLCGQDLTNHILALAIESLQADSGSIMLTDKKSGALSIETVRSLKYKETARLRNLRKGIAWKVVSTGKPMLIRGKTRERSDLVSAVSCPLVSDETVIGVLNINSQKPERHFDPEDLQFVMKIAGFAAGIIRDQKIKKEAFTQSVLLGAREILDLDFPLGEKLNLLLMKVANSFRGKICNLYWYDKDSGRFLVQASSSFDINRIGFGKVKLNDFFTGRMIRCKDSFTFSTHAENSRNRKWFVAQPLFQNGEISGLIMLYLHSNKRELSTESEVLTKIGKMLEQELSKNAALNTVWLDSVKYSALSEATFNLAEIPDIRKLAKMIVTETCLILEAETCILSLYNEVMNCFEILESFSLKGSKQAEILCKVDKAITLKASVQNTPLLINDLFKEGYVSSQIPSRSVISMCLRQNDRIMGAISIYDKNQFDSFQQKAFSNHDQEVFTRLCLQAAAAMNRFLMLKKR